MLRVAIIGAGPAGSSAATLLARAGFPVTLFESRPFPRTKVCGEFISPSGAKYLEALLPPARLLALGARRIDRFRLARHDSSIAWPMPAPGWAISRAALDAALTTLARDAGAQVKQPASIRSVSYSANGVSLLTAAGDAHPADLVIHADGTGRHDPAGPVPCDRRFVAAKCHFQSADHPDSSVAIRSAPGLYLGTIGVEAGRQTCALVARATLITAARGDFDAILDRAWPGRNWTSREEWHACPLPRSGYIRPGHPRCFRIGNAAAAVDPIGGEGIANALWSASVLADLLVQHASATPADLIHVQQPLASAYRRRLRMSRPACAAAAWALMRPGLVRAAWPALRCPSLSLRPWYRLTGKPA